MGSPGQDDEFVRQLYSRYRRPLLGYVLRAVGGDHQRAEDVVQETLLRAWRHAESLEADKAGPWLYTVAKNLVISGYRRQSARVAEVPIEDADWPRSGDEFEQVLQGWQVAEAMRVLSRDHRAVIAELFYRRRTVAEAAKVLGVPPGTVKSRSFYALRALRDALEERGVTEL
ncbi:sigma-70 family RNA polymerase sigma factor [Actinokineospora globicatena]|uniref:RNA polymerase sigma factor n=1 Tax=Actinokineospora globicatena TaxID=103729 RepID=A0A9W6VAQ6_9PSEU|nr:sigma-70 family RNA polymerase sigma factor [Actinokineospora globicatena]MCP2305563.1 RNA polymerase sigma-70 factor, ECF subfamily [Actinokineospora globicatena]GLW81433.1 RNA polymerase sigma factor [Actinokineospora globicatena]GLW87869.1 RNA polymerase sigma factor [Actinokineospora globicatena]GLW94547.1 RNA polymerase sigma factor [Actinokineospora globicatena]